MKKLIWLMILGVIFFIGGQWLGLNISDSKRDQSANKATEVGGASGAQEASSSGRGTDQ